MDRYIDIIMFLCLFGSLKPPLCQSQDAKELPPCQPPPRTIQFLSFFPCTNSSSVTLPEECDIFAYAAAQLAVERINSNTSILSNTTLELLPIATKLNLDPDATLFRTIAILNRSNIGGGIGPFNSVLAAQIAPIVSTRLKKLEVSYGATHTSIEEVNPYFYRSLPSDKFLNEGRLALLVKFNWCKVGLLSSTAAVYRQASESFYRTSEIYQNGLIEIVYSGSFTSSPRRALREMVRVGLRVVIGLFGPDDARRVICEARRFRLTTSEHVWVLPTYYSPHWWEPSDVNCTREEMMESLNSTLFVDGVKFSLADKEIPLEQFNRDVLQKTRDLFPAVSLSGDLSPFLMSSQARRAYDAVWLLSAAWNEALSEIECTYSGNASVNNNGDGANTTVNTYTSDVGISDSFIRDFDVKELQRYLKKQLLSELYNIHGSCFVATDNNSESEHYFGHVLISQFIGGSHCPIGIFWPYTLYSILRFVRLAELSSHYLGPLLQLDNNSFGFPQNCHPDFWWKGRAHNVPPTGGFSRSYSDLGTWALVALYILIAFALIFAATVMVLNVMLRKNKHMKAYSPSLSVIVILGAMIIMLVPLYRALVVSAHRFGLSRTAGDILCQVSQWSSWLGFPLIFITLTVKNYRVYRVFYNKELKERGNRLTDKKLFQTILLAITPEFILLILSTTIGFTEEDFSTTLRFDSVNITREPDPYDYNFLIITYCKDSKGDVWEYLHLAYNLAILTVLIYLSWQNSNLRSRFRKEGVLSHCAIMLTLIGAAICLIAYITVGFFLTPRDQNYLALLFSIHVLSTTVLAVALLGMLFLPLFYRIHKDYRICKTKRVGNSQHGQLTDEYLFLVSEALRLKEELIEKKTQIQQLKQERAQMRQHSEYLRVSKELDTT